MRILFAAYFVITLIQKNISSKEKSITMSDKVILPYTYELKINLINFRFQNDSIKVLKSQPCYSWSKHEQAIAIIKYMKKKEFSRHHPHLLPVGQ
jgi:hypothetical protein